MFIGTFDREIARLLDKEFKFMHSRVVGKKVMWLYVFDKDKYMPLSVESYILAHEMAHVANEEVGHGEKFQELMHLIEVAAYMLQFIDLSKYSDQTVHSNGQEILSRKSIKYELFDGIQRIIDHSDDPDQCEYWEEIKKRVANNK